MNGWDCPGCSCSAEATGPLPIGRGRYDVDIVWTQLGKALRQLRASAVAA